MRKFSSQPIGHELSGVFLVERVAEKRDAEQQREKPDAIFEFDFCSGESFDWHARPRLCDRKFIVSEMYFE
jgi:hypothetical protein